MIVALNNENIKSLYLHLHISTLLFLSVGSMVLLVGTFLMNG